MNQRKNSMWLGILFGVFAVVLLTALAVGLLLSGSWLYRLEVDWLGIEQTSGLEKTVILDNYRAVVRFLSPFYSGPFEMPDLPASAGGVQHFEEVKAIVVGLYIAGLAALVVMALLFLLLRRRFGPKTWLAASISTLALPAALGIGIAIDFSAFFVLFHKIFFNNDYWIFDAATDPVITILPSEYFMHCALFIVLFWLIGSAVFFVNYRRQKKKAAPRALPRSRLSFSERFSDEG